jgi:hypothetical protein
LQISKVTVRERHEQQLQDIAVVSRMAIDLLGLPKSEVIQNLGSDNNAESADEMLRTFVKGREMVLCSGQAH